MPRGARRATQQPPASADRLASPTVTSQAQPTLIQTARAGKKKTVAENAIAINSLHTKIENMSVLLTQVIGQLRQPQPDHDDSIVSQVSHHVSHQDRYATDSPLRSRHRSDIDNNDSVPLFRQHYKSASHLLHAPTRRHQGHRPPYARVPVDPISDRPAPPALHRHRPSSLQELDESDNLQDRVAQLVSAAFAPSHMTGKKLYPHLYIKRGPKKARTSLGELTLAEYNLGFIKLINSQDVEPLDRPSMFQHLEHVNQDAIVHPFADVRAWSEHVCVTIADGDLAWEDNYSIDLLRISMSQNGPVGRAQGALGGDRKDGSRKGADAGALDPQADFAPEILASRPGPPCRLFNNGSCSNHHHQLANGFRQLHVCSSCVYHKCLLIPHPERECKSKEFRKKQHYKEPEAGFGK